MQSTTDFPIDHDQDVQKDLPRHERDVHCLKCKTKTKNTDFYYYTTCPNGKYRFSTVCTACNKQKSVLVKKEEVEQDKFVEPDNIAAHIASKKHE